jgi:methionyl-tRNA formyltransferase
LLALAEAADIATVVTQPDRPAGRGLSLKATPVKNAAISAGLAVVTPERLDAAFIKSIASQHPGLLACVSYGKILPAPLLGIAGMTALNVHPSLLPEYRGASPIQAALREGREETGVSIVYMTDELDAGDIALAQAVPISANDDFGSLHDRLSLIAADMLARAAVLLSRGELPRSPQDASRATFTKPISKEELRIDPAAPAHAVVNLVRSASPSPGAWIVYNGTRLKVLEAEAVRSSERPAGDDLVIACGDGLVRLVRVVPDGMREMRGFEYARWLSRRR